MKSFVLLGILAVACHGFDLDKVIPDVRTMPPRGKFLGAGKIIGGEVVVPNSIPYQVALFLQRSDGTYFCGGSLISNNYVLTAAHCVDGVQSVTVYLGDHDVRNVEPNEVSMVSTNFAAHARYNPNDLSNDIAWIRLPQTIEYNDVIQPATLPSRSDSGRYDGQTGTISGWGKISDNAGGITDLLRSTQADIMEWEDCADYYFQGLVRDTNVCTNPFNGHASCNGDSGGPLTINGVQVGVVSFGSSGGCTAAPSAFTRVHSYLDWIAENTDVQV